MDTSKTIKDFPMVFYPMDPMVYYPMIWNIPMIDPVGKMSSYWVTDECTVWYLNPNGTWTWVPHFDNQDRRKAYLKLRESMGPRGLYLVYRLLMWCHSGIPSYADFAKYQIDHIDCDKHHNYLENLEIVEPHVNVRRAYSNGLYPKRMPRYSEVEIRKLCSDMCNNSLTKSQILAMNPNFTSVSYDWIKMGRLHRDISSQYVPYGFKYADQVRHERYAKAHQVCALFEFGYLPTEVVEITGYPYSFVYPIWAGKTLRPVSDRYSFPGPTTIETVF